MEWIRSKEKLALGWLSTTFTCLACGVLWLAFIVLSSPPASATPPPPDQPNSPKITITPMRITGEQPTSEFETAMPTPADQSNTATTDKYPPPPGTLSATRTPTSPAPGASPTNASPTTIPPTNVVSGGLRVVFIDVSRGLSVLILAPGGQAALFDGGAPEDGAHVLAVVREFGVTTLQLLIASHPHEEHIGGLINILQSISVTKIVTNGQSNVSGVYTQFSTAASASSAEIVQTARGGSFNLGDIVLRIYHPVSANPSGDLNRNSLAVRFVLGQKAFLLTGDADSEAQSNITSAGYDLPSDILQLTDYCDLERYNAAFIQAVRPVYAVCTDGDYVPSGYIAPGFTDILGQLGSIQIRTDQRGKIIFSTDGNSIQISTDR